MSDSDKKTARSGAAKETATTAKAEKTSEIKTEKKANVDNLSQSQKALSNKKEEIVDVTPQDGNYRADGIVAQISDKAVAVAIDQIVLSVPGLLPSSSETYSALKKAGEKSIRSANASRFDLTGNRIKLDFYVYTVFGVSMPAAFKALKHEAEHGLRKLCNLSISELNVTVIDLISEDSYHACRKELI